MRSWFRRLPIRSKLVAITLATSAVALLFATGGFFLWDIVEYRAEIRRDTAAQARIVGENSVAALTFNDPEAAGETLAALELRPRIEMACLYAADGRLFATFHRDTGQSCPTLAAGESVFGWSMQREVVPVVFERRPLGTLMVQRELGDVRDRLLVGGTTMGVLLVLATAVALLIGSRLQRIVATPLLELARTARTISNTGDYSLRATSASGDEIGVVVTAFNKMVDRVQQQTAELSQEIDERRRVEAERAVLLVRERDANRLKDEFLATLSHELRTPLNAVLGWVRMLRSGVVPLATQSRALETIERNARMQARLIEDLLEVSRIITGKLRLQVRPSDLVSIIQASVEVVQPAAAAKGITVTCELIPRSALTSGDPERLQQVIWNLLSNAVKFTPQGGRVAIRLQQNGEYVITVSDSGAGIDPGFLPHIFDAFRQADGSTSRQHGGLGLGLAIVRHLVELHGGTVAARSDGPGKGSTFEVRLPSVIAAEEVMTKPPATADLAAPPVDPSLLAGVHVLVVDDEEDAQELLQTVFRSFGAKVTVVGSAADARRAVERAVPDIVVSDIGMAQEDGYALLRYLRARPASSGGNVPAVALTAYASDSDRERAFAAGYQAHVAKPFDPSTLAALVHDLVGTRSHT